MPLPLLLIGAAVAGVAGAGTWLDSRGRKKTAKNIHGRHYERYETARAQYEDRLNTINEELEGLGRRRFESVKTLRLAVEFLRKAKVKNRDLYEELDIATETLAKWETPSGDLSKEIGNAVKSVTAGVSTTLGVYTTVGLLGTASTGTAISTLSGVAAKNATLAWLGGGSLAAGGGGMALGAVTLGSLAVGPTALVVGLIKSREASKFETQAEEKKAEMQVATAQIKQQMELFEVYEHRISEIRDSIDATEETLQKLIESGDPAIDEDAHQVALAAQTLGMLLDTPVVEEHDAPLGDKSEADNVSKDNTSDS